MTWNHQLILALPLASGASGYVTKSGAVSVAYSA